MIRQWDFRAVEPISLSAWRQNRVLEQEETFVETIRHFLAY